MAKCGMCGKRVGGLFGEYGMVPEAVKSAREHGLVVPDVICVDCFAPFRDMLHIRKSSTPDETRRIDPDEYVWEELKQEQDTGDPLEENARQIEDLLSEIQIVTWQPASELDATYKGFIISSQILDTGSLTLLGGNVDEIDQEDLHVCEMVCTRRLMHQAVKRDANLIAGVRIAYTGIAHESSKIVISMSGTALNVKSYPQELKERFNELLSKRQRLIETGMGRPA